MEITTDKLKENTIRSDYSFRGGGIEIDLTEFGFDGEKMTAYCNYLGGGMIGRVCSSNTLTEETMYTEKYLQEDLEKVELELKKHFFGLVVGDFNNKDWLQNQLLPSSAY